MEVRFSSTVRQLSISSCVFQIAHGTLFNFKVYSVADLLAVLFDRGFGLGQFLGRP